MKPTTVDVAELKKKLTDNRAKHKKEFEQAKKVWHEQSVKALEKAARKAKKTGKITEYPLINLPKPRHYLDSYDSMIARLEAEVNKTVELDDRDFQSYWMDNWTWRSDFAGTTSLYSG